MIDLFILHFKGAFLRLLVNLITKCFISGHVKLNFIDRFLLTLFMIIYLIVRSKPKSLLYKSDE